MLGPDPLIAWGASGGLPLAAAWGLPELASLLWTWASQAESLSLLLAFLASLATVLACTPPTLTGWHTLHNTVAMMLGYQVHPPSFFGIHSSWTPTGEANPVADGARGLVGAAFRARLSRMALFAAPR